MNDPQGNRPKPTMTMYRRARWGPLCLTTGEHRTQAWTPGSGLAQIDGPSISSTHAAESEKMLREGQPVLIDGKPAVTLTQPQRGWLHRRDRLVNVTGDPAQVPSGLILRARWFHSVGMEVVGDTERNLIRPHFDLLDAPVIGGFTLTRPSVDPTVTPEMIAIWAVAQWHLIHVMQRG